MKLTKNFTLRDMTKSQTALRRGINNTPDAAAIENLTLIAEHILEPVMDKFGRPTITSAYRSLGLNTAIGSKPSSQHVTGQAVDFEVMGVSNLHLAQWLNATLDFDQLILEFYSQTDPQAGWVHVSYAPQMRNQCLTIDRRGTRPGLG